MVRHNHCAMCAGSGVCPRCDGWGRRWSTWRGRTHREPCPHCRGVGACGTCDGAGRIAAEPDQPGGRWPGWRWPDWLRPFALGSSR